MPPIAIARQPHHLPGLAIDRQRFRTGNAALGVEADHVRRHRRRQDLAAEQLPGAEFRIVWIGQRRQRRCIDAALVLLQLGGGIGQDGGKQQGEENQAGVHRLIPYRKRSMESAFADQARQSRSLDFFRAGLRLTATDRTCTTKLSAPMRKSGRSSCNVRTISLFIPMGFPYQAGRGREGEAIPASRTARMPVRKTPSNVPAPPIEATGAPRSPILSRLSRSAPISVPIEPPI